MRSRLAETTYYGWVVAAACFLAATVVFGSTYSFGVFFDALADDFEASAARLALVFGIQTFVLYVGAASLGTFVDRYGPRRALLVGGFLLCLGFVLTARSESQLHLLVSFGVVAALGMSLVYVVAYATVPRWFGRRRGLASGVATSGLGVGVLAAAPAAAALIDAFGWRTAYLVLAAACGVVVLVAAALLADHPADVGADLSTEFPDGRPEAVDPTFRDALDTALTPAFGSVLVGWILVYTTLYVVFTHLVRYADAAGLPPDAAALAIGVVGGTTSFARLGVGHLSDRVGRVRVFVVCSLVMACSTALVPLVGPTGLLVLGAVFGVGYGGNGALLSPLTADLFGADQLNAVYGLLSLAFAVSGLLTPSLAALGSEAVGYPLVFAAAGACGIVGAGFVWLGGHLAE